LFRIAENHGGSSYTHRYGLAAIFLSGSMDIVPELAGLVCLTAHSLSEL